MTAQRMWLPSMLATPAQVRALLDGDDLDDTTREHLRHLLASQEKREAGIDPFRGVKTAGDEEEWWVA